MIPFLDLRAQYHSIKPEIDEAVLNVLESTQYVLGEQVAGFEKEFAAYCGASHGIAVNSGTSALHLAFLAAGIGPGDEVITVPFTFVATAAAIRYTGARPVFVDIDPKSYTMDAGRLERAITPKTRAIVPVHLYGQPADMSPIVEIARRRNVPVIEDAAQAHGAEYRGRRVGGIGDMGCFSFYPGKNLGAYGEGGMVVTNNPDFARRIRMQRDWGAEKKYEHVMEGFNYRMEGFQGAILRVKLRHLDRWTDQRRAHAARYDEELSRIGIEVPLEVCYARHVYHVYAIETLHREQLQKHLAALQIQTGIHYPYPVHLTPAHADLGYKHGDFPVAEQAASRVLSLPIYPEMDTEAPAKVAASIRRFPGFRMRHEAVEEVRQWSSP